MKIEQRKHWTGDNVGLSRLRGSGKLIAVGHLARQVAHVLPFHVASTCTPEARPCVD
jgi:hypothetical protein